MVSALEKHFQNATLKKAVFLWYRVSIRFTVDPESGELSEGASLLTDFFYMCV